MEDAGWPPTTIRDIPIPQLVAFWLDPPKGKGGSGDPFKPGPGERIATAAEIAEARKRRQQKKGA